MTQKEPAIIHLQRIDHTGIVVSNLEKALRFYKEVFEIEPVFTHDSSGPEVDSAALGRMVDIEDPDLEIHFAILKIGDTNLELMEYHHPRGEILPFRSYDIGGMHLCFRVRDLEQTRRRLQSFGYDFTAEPIRLTDGPLAGHGFAYFRGHDNLLFELSEVH